MIMAAPHLYADSLWPSQWRAHVVVIRPARFTLTECALILGVPPVAEDEDWATQGVCVGVAGNLFFPERGESTREAKALCVGCPVRLHCLRAALNNGERFGIWGGLSERERRSVRRTHTVAAA